MKIEMLLWNVDKICGYQVNYISKQYWILWWETFPAHKYNNNNNNFIAKLVNIMFN